MIQRVLLCVFFAWFAVAPAIANSCAAECEEANGTVAAMHLRDRDVQAEQESAVPDCYRTSSHSGDTETPSTDAMAAACFVAAAVAMHAPIISLMTLDLSAELDVLVLLPSASFESSPPYKPPRA